MTTVVISPPTSLYICPKCNREFFAKSNLNSHLRKKKPCDSKVIYKCERCEKEFPKKYNYESHIKRKTLCVPVVADTVPVVVKNPENKCIYCKKTFVNHRNMKRHVEISCPLSGAKFTPGPREKIKELEEENRKLKEENRKLKDSEKNPEKESEKDSEKDSEKEPEKNPEKDSKKTNIYNIDQIQTYVNNSTNVINIVANIQTLGSEDMSNISMAEVTRYLMEGSEEYVPNMIKHVHANPKYPQYHNVVYLPGNEVAIAFENVTPTEKSWVVKDVKDISEDLTSKFKRIVHNREIMEYFTKTGNPAITERYSEVGGKIMQLTGLTHEELEKNKEALATMARDEVFRNKLLTQISSSVTPKIETKIERKTIDVK